VPARGLRPVHHEARLDAVPDGAVLAVSGCSPFGVGEPSGTGGVSGRVDELAASFHSVSIGDSTRAVQRAFHLGNHWFRYDSVCVFYGPRGGDGFMVTSRGSKTNRGVGIGDSLTLVRERYPRLHCGEANKDTEYHSYPACTGQVAADRYIWFGGEPISNLTIGDAPLGGV